MKSRWLVLTVSALACAVLVRPRTSEGNDPQQVDLKKPFSHGSHLKELRKAGDRKLTCDDCHVQPEGKTTKKVNSKFKAFPICIEPRMPYPTHDKCISCHPKAFFKKPLRICTNCHVKVDFAKKADMKKQSGKQAPLQTLFSHKLHLSKKQRVRKRFKFYKDCTFCHSFKRNKKKPSFPAHAQCCDCHTKKGVEPSINDCAGCHARPKNQRRTKSKIKNFSHDDHRIDPVSNQLLECTRCHGSVMSATKVARIRMPVMDTCVTCHQGEVAFGYSQCLKCHGKGIRQQPLPQSHKKLEKK